MAAWSIVAWSPFVDTLATVSIESIVTWPAAAVIPVTVDSPSVITLSPST